MIKNSSKTNLFIFSFSFVFYNLENKCDWSLVLKNLYKKFVNTIFYLSYEFVFKGNEEDRKFLENIIFILSYIYLKISHIDY